MSLLHKHQWSKWKITERGTRFDIMGDPVGRYIVQERRCADCGRSEIDEDSVDLACGHFKPDLPTPSPQEP